MGEITQSKFGQADVKNAVLRLVADVAIVSLGFSIFGLFLWNSGMQSLLLIWLINFVAALVVIYLLFRRIDSLIIKRIIQAQNISESEPTESPDSHTSSSMSEFDGLDTSSVSETNLILNITLEEQVEGLEESLENSPVIEDISVNGERVWLECAVQNKMGALNEIRERGEVVDFTTE